MTAFMPSRRPYRPYRRGYQPGRRRDGNLARDVLPSPASGYSRHDLVELVRRQAGAIEGGFATIEPSWAAGVSFRLPPKLPIAVCSR